MIKLIKATLLARPRALLLVAKLYAVRYGEGVTLSEEGIWKIIRGDEEVWLPASQGAYVFTVVREFHYYFSSVDHERVGESLVVDCTRPRIQLIRGMDEPILITGLPEPIETNSVYVRELELPKDGIVIDAGAYCGAASIMFSDVVGPGGLVVSIEPDPANFGALERNTEGRVNIKRLMGALWPEPAELSFAAEGNMGSAVGGVRPGAEVVTVRGFSPSELVEDLRLDRIDAIKLDIEGSEVQVIPALEHVIRQFSPRLIFELHDVGRDGSRVIFDAIDGFGYEVEQVQQTEMERFHLFSAWPAGGYSRR